MKTIWGVAICEKGLDYAELCFFKDKEEAEKWCQIINQTTDKYKSIMISKPLFSSVTDLIKEKIKGE